MMGKKILLAKNPQLNFCTHTAPVGFGAGFWYPRVWEHHIHIYTHMINLSFIFSDFKILLSHIYVPVS